MCMMAYELAINEDIQKRLQDEIDEVVENCNGKVNYESILKMTYLDMVLSGKKVCKLNKSNKLFTTFILKEDY